MNNRDTIAAIATAPGTGAVGIVRISGDDALNVLRRVFRPLPDEPVSHKMYYGEILRGGETVDEVMACYMKAPRTFTCEDCAEIYGHGGLHVLGEVLQTVLENGARLAEPGEFTKRAFLNGRLNLAQAEAVADLISAKTSAARRAALRQLGGGLSQRIEASRDKILMWLAHIELSIDYPEHEDEARNAHEILREVDAVISDLQKLAETANAGRILREGVRVAIVGRPNVGKSTLLNALLHENRAIVHETAGTTRDILTEEIRIADVPLVLTDTAGLRKTTDPIEKIGIEKTREAAAEAQLILYVADATVGLTDEDLAEINFFSDKNILVLMNKSDKFSGALPPNPRKGTSPLDPHYGEGECAGVFDMLPSASPLDPHHFDLVSVTNRIYFDPHHLVRISAKTGEGLEELFARVREMFFAGEISAGGEDDIITRERHRALLAQAVAALQQAKGELECSVPEDLVSISLRTAYIALGEILGAEIGDDIVDRIFAEFCVGK